MPYSMNHIMLEFSEWIIGHGLNAAILTCAQVHLPFVSKGFFFPHSGKLHCDLYYRN